MSQVITTLLDVARGPDAASGFSRCTIEELVETMGPLVRPPLRLVTDVASGLPPAAAPRHLAARALAPLVENAARHARSLVWLSAHVAGDRIEISVRDDGAGVPAEMRARIFDPGSSGTGGTGLGLGIARRVARSVGGEVTLIEGEGAATTFVLYLPGG